MELGYAVQYHVSQSSWLSAAGFCAALRARSFSGVVSALTSILSTESGRSASTWATELDRYSDPFSSSPES